MPARSMPVYMDDEVWDYIDSQKAGKGRGVIISEIILADKKRKEREEKRQKTAESNPAA